MDKTAKRAPLRVVLPMLVGLTVIVFIISAKKFALTEAAEPASAEIRAFDPTTTSCRFGAILMDWKDGQWLDNVQAGWFMTIASYEPSTYNGAPFVPLVWVLQDTDANGNYLPTWYTKIPLTDQGLGKLIDRDPGLLWVIGNEPDRAGTANSSSQGAMYPEMYARAYHDIYWYIKERDPSARVAVAGVLQASPGRLQYLDKVWASYRSQFGTEMPVDVWNMHIYIMPEILVDGNTPSDMGGVALGTDKALAKIQSYDPDGWQGPLVPADTCSDDKVYCFAEHDNMSIFNQQIRAMRQWMKAHGLQNKPLIISEFSILYGYEEIGGTCRLKDEFGNCFPPSRVSNYLANTFSYLENTTDASLGYPADGYHLVQQSMWFSINIYPYAGHDSDLVDVDAGKLTAMGQAFKNYVQNSPKGINLIPIRASSGLGIAPQGAADVRLDVTISNAGNVSVGQPYQVTFYKDAALKQEIGTVTMPALGSSELPGCARKMAVASVTWQNLPIGTHNFWVKVNSGASPIAEWNYSDNVTSGIARVNPEASMMPYIRR